LKVLLCLDRTDAPLIDLSSGKMAGTFFIIGFRNHMIGKRLI
jgi:hypothetical protein